MTKPVRIGIVGCGGIATTHLEGYQLLKDKGCAHFEIAAVCDVTPGRAEAFAGRVASFQGSKPRFFTSIDDLIAANAVDGVDVCTLHADHHGTTIRFLEAGTPVMVEKPMGVTVRAARKMLETARRTGVMLSVAENSRRGLGQRAIAWLFNENQLIGAPRCFSIENMTGPKLPLEPPKDPEPVDEINWRLDKLQTGGGWTYDGGVHLMDSLVVYFGPIDTVYAQQRIFSPDLTILKDGRRIHSEREDLCLVSFRFKNGMVGVWNWSFALPGADFCRVAFYGERGYVLDNTAGGWTHTFGGGFIPSDALIHMQDGTVKAGRDLEMDYLLSLSDSERERLFPHGVLRSVAQECHEFIDCIRKDEAPEVGPDEGLLGLAISAAVYESALLGQSVRIEDVMESRVDAYQRPIDERWGLV